MTEIVTPDSDEIDSTFQQTGDEPTFQGTHTCEDPHVSIDREYYTDQRNGQLFTYTTYYVEGKEVNFTEDQWSLTDDGEHVGHSDEPIEEFCRSHHFNDPQSDVEFAQKHSDD